MSPHRGSDQGGEKRSGRTGNEDLLGAPAKAAAEAILVLCGPAPVNAEAEETLSRVAEHLLTHYVPGERVPVTPVLAEQLGLVAAAVSQALRRLDALGVLQYSHGRSTKLLARDEAHPNDHALASHVGARLRAGDYQQGHPLPVGLLSVEFHLSVEHVGRACRHLITGGLLQAMAHGAHGPGLYALAPPVQVASDSVPAPQPRLGRGPFTSSVPETADRLRTSLGPQGPFPPGRPLPARDQLKLILNASRPATNRAVATLVGEGRLVTSSRVLPFVTGPAGPAGPGPRLEQVAALTRQRILDGTYPPGSPLRIRNLAAEVGLDTRHMVRAWKPLVQEGLLSVGGAFATVPLPAQLTVEVLLRTTNGHLVLVPDPRTTALGPAGGAVLREEHVQQTAHRLAREQYGLQNPTIGALLITDALTAPVRDARGHAHARYVFVFDAGRVTPQHHGLPTGSRLVDPSQLQRMADTGGMKRLVAAVAATENLTARGLLINGSPPTPCEAAPEEAR